MRTVSTVGQPEQETRDVHTVSALGQPEQETTDVYTVSAVDQRIIPQAVTQSSAP